MSSENSASITLVDWFAGGTLGMVSSDDVGKNIFRDLLPVLQRCVVEASQHSPLDDLASCWVGIQNNNAHIKWQHRLSDLYGRNDPPAIDRVYVNMKRLVATAAFACCLREKRDKRVAERWLREAAILFDELPPKSDLLETIVWEDSSHDSVASIAGRLNAAGYDFAASLYWIDWFLRPLRKIQTAVDDDRGAAPAFSRGYIRVPMAVVTGEGTPAEKGWIAWLTLERLAPTHAHAETDSSGSKKCRSCLIPHPATSLQLFKDDFLWPLKYVSPACAFPVVWNVERPDELGKEYFEGDSVGGAVARAVHHLSQEPMQFPDDGVLVLASITASKAWQPLVSANWGEIQLAPVNGIAAKKNAALADTVIETIIEATGIGLDVWDKVDNKWNLRRTEQKNA